MLDDKQAAEYNLFAVSLVSVTHHKGGEAVVGSDFYNLAPVDNPADINWPALVGSLVGLAEFFLSETDDPDGTLQRLALALAKAEVDTSGNDEG